MTRQALAAEKVHNVTDRPQMVLQMKGIPTPLLAHHGHQELAK